MSLVAVCFHPEVAAVLRAAGVHVVLCQQADVDSHTAPAAPVGAAGRQALFVVDPSLDPDRAEQEALAMGRELFCGEPVTVRNGSEATALITQAPASGNG